VFFNVRVLQYFSLIFLPSLAQALDTIAEYSHMTPNTSTCQYLLDISKTQREAMIEPDGMADNL